MTDAWQPGKTYVPGSIVRPTTQAAPGLPALLNPDFDAGNTGWGLSTGWAISTDGAHSYKGSGYANYTGGVSYAQITNNAEASVTPGQQITVTGMVNTYANAGGGNNAYAMVIIQWYDASHAPIHVDTGSEARGGNPPNYFKQSTLTATAPPNAAFARAGFAAGQGSAWVDSLSWSSNYSGPPAGLVYKATQAAPGKSGATEPAWPGNTTTPVTDNQVTWQGVIATQLVWEAVAVNTSGGTEPTWPTHPGGVVHDGTIDWIAKTPAISDPNCPHSKIVVIASSKVYAADGDIIRYCATVNPLDWSSKNDAGYIPFGLSSYGSNDVAAMNLYRSNLVAFNSEGFQMWQVDEDPANTALLDALPVASTQNQAASPVSNDLLFLSAEGVRSMGIAAASTNLQGSDVGMPIDPLVKAAMSNAITYNSLVLSTYVPSLGQYWLSFSSYPPGPPSATGDAPNGFVDAFYSFAYSASGGIGPYTFTISAGALAPGLTLTTDGHIVGKPTAAGNYTWTVQVTDSLGLSGTLPDSNSVGSATVAQFFNTSDCLSTPFAAPILGSTDFTVECAASFDDLTHDTNALVSGRAVNVYGWALQIQGGTLNFRQAVGSDLIDSTDNLSGGSVVANRIYHMAATRKGNVFKLWLDGVLVDTKTIAGAINESSVTLLTLGTSFFSIREACLKGYMQWFALTLGAARYDTNFTPPMSAAQVAGATSAIDFNGALGSTTFTDYTGRVWTTYGNVKTVAYPY